MFLVQLIFPNVIILGVGNYDSRSLYVQIICYFIHPLPSTLFGFKSLPNRFVRAYFEIVFNFKVIQQVLLQ